MLRGRVLIPLTMLGAPLAAQRGPEPTLVLTLFAGTADGHGLWEVPHQPFCVLVGGSSGYTCSGVYDTLALGRTVTATLIGGVSATYFYRSHFGVLAEFAFLGLSFDDACKGPTTFSFDPEHWNEKLCDDVTAHAPSTSAVAGFLGIVARASPRRSLSPYARAAVGFVGYSGGTIALNGTFQSTDGTLHSRAVYLDDHPQTSSVSLQLSGGLVAQLSPGYELRFELRDAVIPLRRVAGPSNDLLVPPTASRPFHQVSVVLGLDIVLEKKRGRRY